MNYKNYYRLIRLYATGKISRERFVMEWRLEQRQVRGNGQFSFQG
jgi:hypothetical protein